MVIMSDETKLKALMSPCCNATTRVICESKRVGFVYGKVDEYQGDDFIVQDSGRTELTGVELWGLCDQCEQRFELEYWEWNIGDGTVWNSYGKDETSYPV